MSLFYLFGKLVCFSLPTSSYMVTPNFMITGLQAAMLQVESEDILPFLKPIGYYTWTALISLLILYSFILTFVSFIQNYERGTQGEKNEEPFSLLQSCWFFSLISIQLGAERPPISKSGKILMISWSCFTVIVLETYTANLAAYFTNPTPGIAPGIAPSMTHLLVKITEYTSSLTKTIS